MKRCSKCGLVKEKSEFHRNSSTADGLHYWCKECTKEYQKTPEALQYHRKVSSKYRQTEKGKEAARRSYWKAPEKKRARSILSYHLGKGHIQREPCHCGELKVQAHHEDYSKPLDVEWLCTKHHID